MRDADHEFIVKGATIAAPLHCGIHGKLDELEVAVEPSFDDMSGSAGGQLVGPPLSSSPGIAVREADHVIPGSGDDAPEPFASGVTRQPVSRESRDVLLGLLVARTAERLAVHARERRSPLDRLFRGYRAHGYLDLPDSATIAPQGAP